MRGFVFALATCFVLAASSDECSSVDADCATQDRVQLLQKMAVVEEHENPDNSTHQLIMAQIESEIESASQSSQTPRYAGLVWNIIKAIKGETVAFEFEWKGKSYKYDIPATDSQCTHMFKKKGKCPTSGCSCFDVAPFAKKACKDKVAGEKCVMEYGEGAGTKDWWKYKVTSICEDLNHDGTAVCLPYNLSPCYYRDPTDPSTSVFLPVGTQCVGSARGGGAYTREYVVGTCVKNTDYEKDKKPIKCNGKLKYVTPEKDDSDKADDNDDDSSTA